MANNRLQIYCNKCLQMTPLAKYYPIDWSVPDDMGLKINTFLEEHHDCFEGTKDKAFGTNMFTFRTEMDEDNLISDYTIRPYKVLRSKKSK